MHPVRLLSLLVLISLSGCVRRDGRNSDCKWPGEPGAQGRPASPWHLSEDAEFAEDLAVRYTDAHHGPRSGNFVSHRVAGQERERCVETLFAEAGKTHGVSAADIRAALGGNRLPIDLAVNIPFLLLYGLSGILAVRLLIRRYPLADGWLGPVAMVAFCSLAFGFGAIMLGEQWSGMAEDLRLGTGHLSYRAFRLPWVRYQGWLFALNVVLFWAIAALRYGFAGRANQGRIPTGHG